MKKNYVDGYIPVRVKINEKRDIWYLDIRNLSLSQLIELKKELKGYEQSVAALDAQFHKEANDFDFMRQELRKERNDNKNRNISMKMRSRKKR